MTSLSKPSTNVQTFSLQKRLIVNTLAIGIISSLFGLIIVVAMVGYDSHQLFDDILEENAKLWHQQQTTRPQLLSQLEEYNEELELDYQIIENNRIIKKSEHAPVVPFIFAAKDDEFYNLFENKKMWRIYVLNFDEDNIQIQIAQTWQQRYEHLLSAIAHFIWIMLLLWLLLAIGNWWVIRRSLQPLKRISEQITEKNAQNLSAIQPTLMLSELQPMLDSINGLLFRLDQALQAEHRFTSDAAHELRTPLSAIQMKLQLLQRRHKVILQPITAEMEQLSQDVKRSTAVVENLLLLARLDPQHQQKLPKTTFLLQNFLDEIWQTIFVLAAQKEIECIDLWNISAELTITANRELWFTALRNVLDNAVRYGVHAGKIKFTVEKRLSSIVFLVQDNGVGVNSEQKQQLTQRFYRVLGTEQQGSGLGLSIVQHIVNLHGATMQFVDGLEQTGLGVKIELPL